MLRGRRDALEELHLAPQREDGDPPLLQPHAQALQLDVHDLFDLVEFQPAEDDDLVHAVPPGALGLTLQPYWSPGIRFPGPEAKGAVIGFGDVHTRAHLYRAILEGLAYALREDGAPVGISKPGRLGAGGAAGIVSVSYSELAKRASSARETSSALAGSSMRT